MYLRIYFPRSSSSSCFFFFSPFMLAMTYYSRHHPVMDDIVELCALCSTGNDPVETHLGSVLAFMVQRTACVALSRMSPVERGTLTLRLISAGGLQHDACRRFLFMELSPPYSTPALMRQSHELYLKPATQMVGLEDDDASAMMMRRSAYSMPLQSLLRGNVGVKRFQPPVDFRGSGSKQLLSALLYAWDSAETGQLLLGELPPGLATFLVLHFPSNALRLLRSTVVLSSVPPTWRELWRRLISPCANTERATSTIHLLLTQEPCAKFWLSASRVLVYPLAGIAPTLTTDANDDDNDNSHEGEECNQSAALEGPTMFLAHAMLRLWLSEIQDEGNSDSGGKAIEATGSLCRRALVCGMRLVERDEVCLSSRGPRQGRAGAVRTAYGLLLSIYHGHNMAAHYVRSALDHPDVTLFVPSFTDLNEEEDAGQWVGSEDAKHCSSSAFVAALALRLPPAQLYIADQVWQLLELTSTCQTGSPHEEQMAELEARLQVLLNSHVFSDISVDATCETMIPTSHCNAATSMPQVQEELPSRTLRLKRARPEEGKSQYMDGGGSNNNNNISIGNRMHVFPTASEVSAAASQLRGALVEFATEEFAKPLIVRRPASLHSTFSAKSPDGGLSFGATRLVLSTPLHMKALLGLLAPPSSSSSLPLPPLSCSVAVRDVCCVLMSVLLYRHCIALQHWLSHEECDEQKAEMTQRFTWRIRRWLRFFAPLGAYRYVPVTQVLLPECLSMMEIGEGIAEGRRDLTSAAIAAVEEFCSLLRTTL